MKLLDIGQNTLPNPIPEGSSENNNDTHRFYGDQRRFIMDNFDWVSSWLSERLRPCLNPEVTWRYKIGEKNGTDIIRQEHNYCQIFKRTFNGPAVDEDFEYEHWLDILQCSVFGRREKKLVSGVPCRTMGGFLEFTGRLPTEKDEIEMYCFTGRYLRMTHPRFGRFQAGPSFILSECCVKPLVY